MKKTTKQVAAIRAFLIASTILHFTFLTLHSYAATINQVIVRQQWPWSKDVKVEYSLTGVDASHPVDLTVTAYNGDTPLAIANPQESIKGDLYGITEEFGEFYIDPVAAFGSERIAMTKFKVKLVVADSAANVGEVLYKIFCLTNSNEEVVNVTRADLLNGKYGAYTTDFSSLGEGFSSPATDVLIWTGVTNDVKYKTSHLVMRKIPAKNQTFLMGSPSDEVGRAKCTTDSENQVSVRFTNDYYVAVFELTQAQYRNIANASPSAYTGEDADYHPVEKVSYNTLRGAYSQLGPSGEKIFWPTNTYMHEVYSGSTMAKLRTKFANAYEFDLLTEAQWEYACRAKTTTAFNNGKNLASTAVYASANLESVAWYVSSDAEAQANNNPTHVVGMKAPNAWGLYDMHGNVSEICLDVAPIVNINPNSLTELVDPPGLAGSKADAYRIIRGGSTRAASWYARSAARTDASLKTQIYCGGSTGESATAGVRVAFQEYDAD